MGNLGPHFTFKPTLPIFQELTKTGIVWAMKRLILCLIIIGLAFPALAQDQSIPASREQINLSFAPLVKQVAPAVVNIYAEKHIRQRLVSPLLADPFLRRLFEGTLPPGYTRERMEKSLGSGVIVRADGTVVTSNHVIEGADEIRVVLSDRREYDATVAIADARSDLAVLRIDTKGQRLPYLELADSDEAEVGDLVLAIGDPFGVGQTVTNGIISALARTAVSTGDIDYFIQTDAAINPGNSGGALVMMNGKLVGINAAIYSRDGGSLGIGFAVPSNMVRAVLNGVAQGQKALVHPWTGISGQDLTVDLAASLNISPPAGFLVNEIHAASPALKAGLKIGDVIVSVNNRAVDDQESFRYRIATMPAGTQVTLGVLRGGQKMNVSFALITAPEIPPRNETKITGENPLSGATLANISPAVIEQTSLEGIDHGVVAIGIAPESVAASIGLHPNDLILAINGIKTPSVKDVVAAISLPLQMRGWRVTIQRGDSVVTLVVGD